jgi:hypothetical protein
LVVDFTKAIVGCDFRKNYREKYAVEKAVDSGKVFLTNEQTPHVIDDTFLLLSRRRG